MIKHIVFDIGNVLMSFAPEAYFKRWFQSEDRTHRICSRIFTHEAWEKYDQGIWMLEDLYAVYHKAYPDMLEGNEYRIAELAAADEADAGKHCVYETGEG